MAAPCRRLDHAARWNGSAPHTATGAASVSDAHCHEVNCSAGTIAMATTGTASVRHTSSRVRNAASAGSGTAPSWSGSTGGGAGSVAV